MQCHSPQTQPIQLCRIVPFETVYNHHSQVWRGSRHTSRSGIESDSWGYVPKTFEGFIISIEMSKDGLFRDDQLQKLLLPCIWFSDELGPDQGPQRSPIRTRKDSHGKSCAMPILSCFYFSHIMTSSWDTWDSPVPDFVHLRVPASTFSQVALFIQG